MKETIPALRAELEELEKRIKTISSAQTYLSASVAIKEYFEKVDAYLNTLLTQFTAHTEDCESLKQSIEELENQIATINQTLQNLPSNQEYNLETMSSNINTLLQDVETLKANSTTTHQQFLSDISTIQTDIGYINEDIDAICAENEQINQHIGNLQTTVTNLNSVTNNLSTSQNNLSARLTKAENNISTLTNGVDVSGLDSRIADLEYKNMGNSYIFSDFNYGFEQNGGTLQTREYSFSVAKESCLKQIFTLYYTSAQTGTLTVEILDENQVVKTSSIDLAKNPESATICYKVISNTYTHNIRIKITTDQTYTLNGLTIELVGNNIIHHSYEHNFYSACYNGKIYVTKIENGEVTYGVFEESDTIDPQNLPNSLTLADEKHNNYLSCQIIPKPYCYAGLNGAATCVVKEGTNGYYYGTIIQQSEDATLPDFKQPATSSGYLVSGQYNGIRNFSIQNDTPKFFNIDISNSQNQFVPPNESAWLRVCPIHFNQKYKGDDYYSLGNTKCIALAPDGIFYYFCKKEPAKVYPIAKGENATAYMQTDESMYVYITNKNTVDKYLVGNSSSAFAVTHIKTYLDTNRIYETYNNKYFKHIVSSNTWVYQDSTSE